jgi:OOP family OmpA-OmpF porin
VNRFRLFAGRVVAVLSATLLAACAGTPPSSSSTRVVLLPQADGSSSALVVRSNNDFEETLSKPYQRATTATRGAPVVDQADPARVQAEHRLLFEMLPPAAARQGAVR